MHGHWLLPERRHDIDPKPPLFGFAEQWDGLRFPERVLLSVRRAAALSSGSRVGGRHGLQSLETGGQASGANQQRRRPVSQHLGQREPPRRRVARTPG
jgi:hypothetical protein